MVIGMLSVNHVKNSWAAITCRLSYVDPPYLDRCWVWHSMCVCRSQGCVQRVKVLLLINCCRRCQTLTVTLMLGSQLYTEFALLWPASSSSWQSSWSKLNLPEIHVLPFKTGNFLLVMTEYIYVIHLSIKFPWDSDKIDQLVWINDVPTKSCDEQSVYKSHIWSNSEVYW